MSHCPGGKVFMICLIDQRVGTRVDPPRGDGYAESMEPSCRTLALATLVLLLTAPVSAQAQAKPAPASSQEMALVAVARHFSDP